jgi:predicted acetyltransferase
MTRLIKELNKADFDDFVTLTLNAYPGIKITSEEDKERFRQRLEKAAGDDTTHFYGLFVEDQLWGGMRLYDFTMKLLSTTTLVGGVGGVAVDLAHKKKKVARDLIRFFLQHYRAKGACMVALYPFRPDFYKKMGFGYGSKMNQYRIKPAALPASPLREQVALLDASAKAALNECYSRYLAKTNGLMLKSDHVLEDMFTNPALKVVGYWQDGRLLGYLLFTFQPTGQSNFLSNNIVVQEFVYETAGALQGLLAFLQAQADQVDRVIFNTQDENFHHLLPDPRNGSENLLSPVYHESNLQGVGIMYRVIDTRRLFTVLQNHNFGGQGCRLKLSLTDSFFSENEGSIVIHFVEGMAHLDTGKAYDVAIDLDIAEFSSMAVGAVGFRHLYEYGLAEISDANYVDVVQRLFQTNQKPLCMTRF